MIRNPQKRKHGANTDAVVVGSGPNGLAAALLLARAGLEVEVIEGARMPGGGCRTEELTLPGFRHDVCSAVHPLAAASPFFTDADLGVGIKLVAPKVAFAHPLDGGLAAAVVGTARQTAAGLGADESAYCRLMAPLVQNVTPIVAASLAPIRSLPRSPVAVGRFGMLALQPATRLTRRFETARARALLAGAAAHSMLSLSQPLTAGFGLLLTILAHSTGWPVAEGGSAAIAAAMVAQITSLGGTVSSGRWITRLDELPPARVVVLDITPRALVRLAGSALPAGYRRALERFRYSPGVCKVDWALDGPVPWTAQACLDTVTLHLGGSAEEVRRNEDQVATGHHPQRPFCIVAQPCVADASRAPAGKHTLWAYCHVPAGSPVDMSGRIEAQIERFAPGFRDLILARSVRTAAQMEEHNPNYVGGDINAGAGTVRQTLLRPVPRWNPYRTPLPGVYLCSSSTSPGGGVHGMCGAWAARTALADLGAAPLRYRGGLPPPSRSSLWLRTA